MKRAAWARFRRFQAQQHQVIAAATTTTTTTAAIQDRFLWVLASCTTACEKPRLGGDGGAFADLMRHNEKKGWAQQ